jgi:hypothetical protein
MLTVFSIISRQPISEQLDSVCAAIQQRGWVNIEATHSLESLLNTGGSQWFVTNLVKVSSMSEILPHLFSIYCVSNAVTYFEVICWHLRVCGGTEENHEKFIQGSQFLCPRFELGTH